MANILKGTEVAQAISEKVMIDCSLLREQNVFPKLALVRIGDKEDDVLYEKGIINRAQKVGVKVKSFHFDITAKSQTVIDTIKNINRDKKIQGCLVFRPLGDKKLEDQISQTLLSKKDLDCMTIGSLSRIFVGEGSGYPPATADACVELLKYYGIELKGANVVVLGRSLVIGKPVSILLQDEDATVTMCHSKSRDLKDICKRADILVVAIGRARFVDDTFVSPGQTVVDVGINVDDSGNICGDVDFEKVEPIVANITPVPEGVGSVTTSVLMKHLILACREIG